MPRILLQCFQDLPGNRVQIDLLGAVLWAMCQTILKLPSLLCLMSLSFGTGFSSKIPIFSACAGEPILSQLAGNILPLALPRFPAQEVLA